MIVNRRDFLVGLAAAVAPGANRGPVAFHYEAIFPPDALDWYTRFDVLVTGAVLSPSQTALLKRSQSRLVAYEWSSGFYPGDSVSAAAIWQESVRKHARGWLLSTEPATGGAAAAGRVAHWYDFGSSELIAARAEYLAELIRSAGYQGLFFDTPGFEQLPPAIQAAWKQRNPKDDYNRRQGEFFGAVKRRLGPTRIVFLNQGYRHADEMLPYADMDLTESYFTAVQGNGTRFRKWHAPAAPWETVRTPMEQLVKPAALKFPKVRFVHVNYAAGGATTARRAARYSWACAKLFGQESYLISPGAYPDEREDVYFHSTGRPTAEYKESGALVWRQYERGVVALNASPAAAAIPELGLKLSEPWQGYWFPSA